MGKRSSSKCRIRWSETSVPRLWRAAAGGKHFELNRVWPRQSRFFLSENGHEVGEFKSRKDATRAAKKLAC